MEFQKKLVAKKYWDRICVKYADGTEFTGNEINLTTAPCFICGYNGSGYYQPDTHPCAERYHRLYKPSAFAGYISKQQKITNLRSNYGQATRNNKPKTT